MKRLSVLPAALFLAFSALTVVVPTGSAQAGPIHKEAKYRAGFNDGYGGGYRSGFFDGKSGKRYRVKIDQGRGAYMLGYVDGYYKGYANGYSDGVRRQRFYVPVIRW